jgi:hypothetical protein
MRPFAQLALACVLALPLGCGDDDATPSSHGYVPASTVKPPRPVVEVVAPHTFGDPAAALPSHDNPNGVDGTRPAREP